MGVQKIRTREAEIGDLPTYRCQGVGAALMQALVARSRADGLRAISLSGSGHVRR